MQLGFRRLVPFLLGASALGILVIGAGAAGPSEKDEGLPVKRVVMFASDGMRPDLMEKYAKDGAMPTYKELMKDGITGDNGMTPGLPAEHGRRLVHDGHRHVPVRARLDEQHVLPCWRFVREPDVVLGGEHDAGRHDCQRRRARGQEGRFDRLGRWRCCRHRRARRRLHEFLLEPRRARRCGQRDRARGLGLLRRRPTRSAAISNAVGLDQRPGRRPGGDAEADDVADPSTFAAQNPNRTYNVYFYDSVSAAA